MYRSNVGRDTVGLPNMDPVRVGIGGNQSVGAKTCFSDRLIDIFDAFCQKIIQFFVKKSDHYPQSVAQICSWREQYSIVILAGYTCWTIGSWSSAFVGQSTPIKKKTETPFVSSIKQGCFVLVQIWWSNFFTLSKDHMLIIRVNVQVPMVYRDLPTLSWCVWSM